MRRADRLMFVPVVAMLTAGDAWYFALSVVHGQPSDSVLPLLGTVGWASITYYLWRRTPMRVDLGKDRWADIVDPDDMTHGTKMRVQALLPVEGDEQHPFVLQMRMQEKLVAEIITAWSFDKPVPGGDPAALVDVPGTVYDALIEASEPHWDSLDFFRPGKSSSDSRTSSEGTKSPAKRRPAAH